VIFNVLMNLVLYMVFTVICFYAAYPPAFVSRPINAAIADSKLGMRLPDRVRRAITVKRMPKEQVIAVCLCGAAKTQALGIPLADAMWTQSDNSTKSLIQIPVLLYTMEQVFTAQFLTILFRWWLEKDKKRESDEESDGAGEQGHEQEPAAGDSSNNAGLQKGTTVLQS
jgi:solute carrier family 10 (sodium/bile acid cotransporter), member 7